jgi:hypothetical protein
MSVNSYEVINSHIERFKNTLKTQTVGKVTQVNYVGEYIESVTVKPYVNTVYKDGLIMEKASCYRVPLIFPSSGGGIMSFPVEIGDPVLLMFCHEDIEAYMDTGAVSDPNTLRKFTSNDVVAIPCLYPYNESLRPSKDKFQIKYKGADISIDSRGAVTVNSPEDVTITGATTVKVIAASITLQADDVTCTGNFRVDGTVSTGGDVTTDDGISLNTHTHGGVKVGTTKTLPPN